MLTDEQPIDTKSFGAAHGVHIGYLTHQWLNAKSMPRQTSISAIALLPRI